MSLRHTQENRFMVINTTLGEDVLLLSSLQGQEALSALFSFQLELVSEDHNIVFKDIIGENVAIALNDFAGQPRYFHGIISTLSQGQGSINPESDLQLASYTATLVPWLWLLTMTSDTRIYQELSVPEIVEKIFSEKGMQDYQLKLQGSYDPRTYCVQYRETDYDFICRILEEEGIYFYFEHQMDKHVLIIADSPDEHEFYHKQETARYHSGEGKHEEEDVITRLERTQGITLGKYTINDYNFTMPSTDLKTEVESRLSLGPGEREFYDYPGEFENRGRGDHLANIRMQADEVQITTIDGSGDCLHFSPGYKFKLEEYFRADMNDEDYVLISISHSASQPIGLSGEGLEDTYSNEFTCIPFDVPFRPSLNTPKPLISGNQTAIVVGPAEEEIYTDEHGRVKVQFHWDREGQNDENSSCWMRVSQVWAGTGWGAMFIPRIGQEVIVDFLEGDPDRPIITGRVYHGSNTPPYPLPGDKNKSTIKSNSTIGGGGSNEILLDDTKGVEEIYIHGQYDMNSTIEHDQTLTVHNNRTSTIDVNDSESVGSNQSVSVGADQSTTVGSNQTTSVGVDQTLDVGTNQTVNIGSNQSLTVGSNQTETIGSKKDVVVGSALSETIGANATINIGGSRTMTIATNDTISIGAASSESVGAAKTLNVGGPLTITAGGAVTINAPSGITLNCGGSSIAITPGSIAISGPMVSVTGSGTVTITGAMIKHNT